MFHLISKLVKQTQLCLVFLTLFLVFGNWMKHFSSCLIYYINSELQYLHWLPVSMHIELKLLLILLYQWNCSELSKCELFCLHVANIIQFYNLQYLLSIQYSSVLQFLLAKVTSESTNLRAKTEFLPVCS